jgi:hypothetical protein
MNIPGSPIQLAHVLAGAMDRKPSPHEVLGNFKPDEVGAVHESVAGRASFRVTYIDSTRTGAGRRFFTVTVREGA